MNAWAWLGAALSGVVLFLAEMFKLREAKADGVKIEAGRVNAETVQAQERMADAVAKAPDTKAETVKAMRDEEF